MSDINDYDFRFKDGAQVQTDDIADGAVTAAKLADGTISTGDIANGAVTSDKLASNAVTTVKITDANVTLAKLAAGITPSHVIKFAGTGSYAGGGTQVALTVTGAAATDIASAVIRASTNAVSIVKAVVSTNTLTVDFSADPGAGTTIDYHLARAAA